eukprot:m.316263 g.316263  ORF g.316263 m.316263 type:complete len:142 (-) comp16421_c4_seq2:557-982(-)
MPVQIRAAAGSKIAQGARERLLARVDSNVCRHRTFRARRVVAERARERLLSRVSHADVSLEIVLLRGPVVTLGAGEWLFASVPEAVPREFALGGRSVVAVGATQWLFTAVQVSLPYGSVYVELFVRALKSQVVHANGRSPV